MPCYGDVKAETVVSLLTSLSRLNCGVHFNFVKNTYVHEARNQIVSIAQSVGATHLMFIDADMAFPSDGITRLLAHEKEIVGAMYNMRSSKEPISTLKMADKDGNFIAMSSDKIPKDRLFKCGALGTGFVLIKMSVFDKLEKPYFWFGMNKDGGLIGEDVYFFMKCREKGIDVWCDPTIHLGHIGDYCY